MTRFARPSGRRRRRLRCLSSFDSNLRQVRILYIADSKKAPLGRFLHGGIVQDDSLRSPFGPSPQASVVLFRSTQTCGRFESCISQMVKSAFRALSIGGRAG